MTNSSNEYVYVRGGGKYYFTIEGTSNAPVLHSSAYTASSQTIELKTPEEITPIEVTGVTKTELTSELKILNDEISARVTKTDFNAQNEAVGEQIGQLTTSYNSISGTVSNMNSRLGVLENSGFIMQENFVTLFSQQLEDSGEAIASSINLTPNGITLFADKVKFANEEKTIVLFGTDLYAPLGLNLDEDTVSDIYDYFMEDAESDSIAEAMKELGSGYEEFEVRLVRLKFLCEVAN